MQIKGIGLRTIKTAISIGIGMLIYILMKALDTVITRGGVPLYDTVSGFRFSDIFSPFFSGIAATYSLYPSKKETLSQAKNRVVASLLGGLVGIGLTILYGLIGKISGNDFFTWPNLGDKFTIVQYIIPYTLVALGVIVVIVIGNFVHKKSAIFVGILTFISVTINPMGMIVDRYNQTASFLGEAVFGFNRILSTIMGVIIAIGVNFFRLPHKYKNDDMVFYVGIEGLLKKDNETLTGYFKYKMIEAAERGIPCSIFTTRAPMTFMHLVDDVKVTLPICCMSGAALYDSYNKKFLYLDYIEDESKIKLDKFFKEKDLHPFKNYVFNDSVIITIDDINVGYNKAYFDSRKDSAYCNIINTDQYDDKVLYYLFLDEEEKINEIIEEFKKANLYDELFLSIGNCYEEFGKGKNLKYLKVYDKTVRDLKGFKEYLKENNKKLVSLTSDSTTNYLLDASDYKATFKDNVTAKDVDLYLNNYKELFFRIKRIYYSKKTRKIGA